MVVCGTHQGGEHHQHHQNYPNSIDILKAPKASQSTPREFQIVHVINQIHHHQQKDIYKVLKSSLLANFGLPVVKTNLQVSVSAFISTASGALVVGPFQKFLVTSSLASKKPGDSFEFSME